MYLRKLPSGKWQATVYLPDGRRRTYTDPLKSAARAWGVRAEDKVRRGEWGELLGARTVFADWRARWWDARVVEDETRRGDVATLKHIDAAFRSQLLGSITRMDVQAWVRQMEMDGVGPHAIRRAYNLLATMMRAAVLEDILAKSPCRKIVLPATPPKAPEWFTHDEVLAIVRELDKRHPGHAVAVALMCWAGPRWGEMAGLRIGDLVPSRSRIKIVGARTQAGRWKEYPKTSKSRREVPCPEPIMASLVALAGDRAASEPVFITNRGARPLSGANWRLVWTNAIKAINKRETVAAAKEGRRAALVPEYSPHTCRHTAASWLVQAGVDLYRVQALLGHESFATTMRYAHLAPGAHAEVETAWAGITAGMKAIGTTLAEDDGEVA